MRYPNTTEHMSSNVNPRLNHIQPSTGLYTLIMMSVVRSFCCFRPNAIHNARRLRFPISLSTAAACADCNRREITVTAFLACMDNPDRASTLANTRQPSAF